VSTISDFRELNKRIVRKPYPIPKISTILQELEGFTNATALDLNLNMGYYTIRLDSMVSKMCTIIFPGGKYSYKRLPMGFAGGSADIFQAQIMDLMAVDIGLVESPFQHTCLKHLQDCVVNGD
jgi:hypothetical protein